MGVTAAGRELIRPGVSVRHGVAALRCLIIFTWGSALLVPVVATTII